MIVEVDTCITCLSGACEDCIGIHANNKWRWSGWLLDSKTIGGSYGGLKLLGDCLTMAKGKCLLGPRFIDKRFFYGGIWALLKVLEAYMGEAVLLAEST